MFIYVKVTAWKTYDGEIVGVLVKGDPKAPPTTRWNNWYLAWRGWRTVAVFSAKTTIPYRVGYKPFNGPPKLLDKLIYSKGFGMKIGYEDRTFFAVDVDGQEVILHHVGSYDKDETAAKEYPVL